MKKEIYYIILTFIITLILHLFLNGYDNFIEDSPLDINIHDTYFVITNIGLFFLFLPIVFTLIYLIRSIYNGFNNKIVNYVFIISNTILILLSTNLALILNLFVGFSEVQNGIVNINFITSIQTVLLVLLIYASIKTGKIK